ncbi:MAG TPA: NRDE family protein [Kofleriaceae bacterium]|nr:NRDE family protein [Kofleriaceae bacterium]
MCTIALLVGVVEYPLVIAANRDEFYARETGAPRVLAPHVVGGIDLKSGGTWLALHARGSFAAVTNQRVQTPPLQGVRSRGLVVLELAQAADPDAYVAALEPRDYASMNLAWGDALAASIAYLRHDGTKEVVKLPRGIHVLTNDRLGSPEFPRANVIEAAIAAAPRDWEHLAPALQNILGDHSEHAVPHPPPLPALTATCIHTPTYGTRSATIAAFDLGRVAQYLHADGPPCTTPFEDLGALVALA